MVLSSFCFSIFTSRSSTAVNGFIEKFRCAGVALVAAVSVVDRFLIFLLERFVVAYVNSFSGSVEGTSSLVSFRPPP